MDPFVLSLLVVLIAAILCPDDDNWPRALNAYVHPTGETRLRMRAPPRRFAPRHLRAWNLQRCSTERHDHDYNRIRFRPRFFSWQKHPLTYSGYCGISQRVHVLQH